MMTDIAAAPSAEIILQGLAIVRPAGNLLLVAICPRKAEPICGRGFTMPEESQAAADWALDLNIRLRMNLYFTVNVTPERHKKAAKTDMTQAVSFWSDCDPQVFKFGGYEKARDYLMSNTVPALQGKATFAIDSGNGISPFFELQDPLQIKGDFDSYEALNDQVGRVWSGATTHNCDRVMRLPGTWNYPNDAKIAKGYPSEPGLARLLFTGGPTYTMDGIREMVRRRDMDNRFWNFLTSSPAVAARYSGSVEGLSDQSGSAMDFSMVSMLKLGGFQKEEARELLANWQHGSTTEQRKGDRYWERCWERTTPDSSFSKSGTSSAPDKTITAENHPFANFLPYALGNLDPDEFIFDDILIAGVTLLAGFTGIGKTTALVPLMTRAAHLCDADDTLRPLLRRRVIYVSEDPKQVVRVLTSMRVAGELTATDAEIIEWFKIVPAKRMDAASIVKVREIYQAMVYRNVSKETGVSYDALPIVVLDTSNATIELENESDNSEVGKAVSTLKSELGGIPLIIVAHLAKTLKKADISDMTSRGAGAWEGDVNQVLYMTKEDDGARWLDVAQAKHRFVTKADGIVFRAVESEIKGRDMLGNEKDIFLMHCKPEMVQRGGREAMQEQSKQVAARNKEVAEQMVRIGRKKRIKAILDGLKVGEYKTKNELSKEMGGNKDANLELINEMVEDGLIEQFVPSSKRDKNHNNGYRMTSNGGQEYENASKGI
jgi:RecA-family ATPase